MRLSFLFLLAASVWAQDIGPSSISRSVIQSAITIPAGTDPSEYVAVGTATPVGLFTPAVLTGTNYEFFCKFASGDTGVAVTGLTVAHVNSVYVPFTAAVYEKLLGCPYVALATDGTEAASRAVTLVYRDLTDRAIR